MLRMASCLAISTFIGSTMACKAAPSQAPTLLTETSFTEDGKTVQVEVSALTRGDELELEVRLSAIGTQEMDKLVLDLMLSEFILVEGEAQWTGFVPPRQPQRHRATVRLQDGQASGEIRVSVKRSLDSWLLYSEAFSFARDAGTVVPQN